MREQNEKMDLELEAVMTESAFGHEYARQNLKEDASYTLRQALLANMDHHKKNYFWARQKMEKINPDRLLSIEEGLRWQKEMVLGNHPTIH